MNLQPAPVPANAQTGGSSLLGSFVIAARQRGVHLSVAQLIRDHQLPSGEVSSPQLLRIAASSGLRAKATRLRWASLVKLGTALPAIVLLRNGSAMVLAAHPCGDTGAAADRRIAGPERAAACALDARRGAFHRGLGRRRHPGQARLPPARRGSAIRACASFSAQLLRDRRVVRDLGICAVMLSILALSPIMFWRVARSTASCITAASTPSPMICIAFAGADLCSRRLSAICAAISCCSSRPASTSSCGATCSTRCSNLPIDFFERTSTGDIVRDMNEMFKIRGFLTGQLFGTVLDSVRPADLPADHVFLQRDHDGRACWASAC